MSRVELAVPDKVDAARPTLASGSHTIRLPRGCDGHMRWLMHPRPDLVLEQSDASLDRV